MAHLFKRGKRYYIKYYLAGKQKEKSLGTDSLQLAKELQRQFESGQTRGEQNPLPSRTPLAEVLTAYVQHIRAIKTAKSAQNDIYYLREAFGPICEALTITSRTPSSKTRKTRSKVSQQDRRRKLPVIEAACIEELTPQQIGAFIDFKVRDQGLKPKTANHYRSIIRRLINWSVETYGIRLPGQGQNPASKVKPYKEQASEIRYLTLPQIGEQLDALRFNPRMQTMVAVLIYAGVRREELLWITKDDVELPRAASGGGGILRIRAKTLTMPDGETRYWQPKTRHNRAIPISSALRAFLDSYTAPDTPGSPSNPLGLYFPSPQGTLYDPDNFSSDLRQVQQSAGLQWSCLDFRHTFGSQLAQKGVSLYKISTLMGNSPEICRRHYAALVPEALVTEVEFHSKSPIPISLPLVG